MQLLAKSCKPVPVMLFGALLGKRYSIYKYLNVLAISTGFVLFMNKGVDSSSDLEQTDADVVYYGAIALLIISLCFDGFTGAFEDRLMEAQEIGPFDLMFNIQLGKALMSLAVLLLLRQQDKIIHVLQSGGPLLVVIGVAGMRLLSLIDAVCLTVFLFQALRDKYLSSSLSINSAR